jgi:uncharacterized membrane protein YsdA (DUF1294 family)
MIDLVLLLLAGNLIAFGLFWFDKAQARNGGWRISERTLLFAVAFGGLGAWMGQHILRHKTRKQPFATWLGLIASLYVLILLTAAAHVIWKALPA